MSKRVISAINFSITTHCNMRCPFCCAGITDMNKADKQFYGLEYFENAAKYFQGMDINVTGGEPTIHPQFDTLVPKLKEMFNCGKLSIWTNGTTLKKKANVMKHFDIIHISDYGNAKDQIKFIQDYYPNKPIFVVEPIHVTNQGSTMCFRGYSETVEFVDGYIYPCCAASGTKTKTRIPLSDNWKEEILTIKPACHECVFGEK